MEDLNNKTKIKYLFHSTKNKIKYKAKNIINKYKNKYINPNNKCSVKKIKYINYDGKLYSKYYYKLNDNKYILIKNNDDKINIYNLNGGKNNNKILYADIDGKERTDLFKYISGPNSDFYKNDNINIKFNELIHTNINENSKLNIIDNLSNEYVFNYGDIINI
jgi:hypothetical protein